MKNIAVICGGDSSEREVSVNSTLNVIKYVDRLKYCPYIVFIQGTNWFVMPAENQDARTVMEHQGAPTVDKNTFSFGSGNGLTAFDVALIMIHGTPGENGLLQGYLEMQKVPFTSCSSFAVSYTHLTLPTIYSV